MRLTTLAALCAVSTSAVSTQSHKTSSMALEQLADTTNMASTASPSPAVGMPVPAGSLPSVTLDQYRQVITSHKAHYLIVDFWATTCGPCRAELPSVIALADSLKALGVNFVTVSGDEASATQQAAAFLDTLHAPAERYIMNVPPNDTAIARAYVHGVEEKWEGDLPAIFVYDPSGKLIQSFMTKIDLGSLLGGGGSAQKSPLDDLNSWAGTFRDSMKAQPAQKAKA